MKKVFLMLIILLAGCNTDNLNFEEEAANKVLMLKVDYTTNVFEGGIEFSFSQQTKDFTIINEYVSPSDFGSIKLIYKELNKTLFDGTIVWMGTGKMTFPEKLKEPEIFNVAESADIVKPANGFENIFNPYDTEFDHYPAWLGIQNLTKVREYLSANTTQKVKLFLYTPSVGAGDPLDWDWIIYLKK